MMRGVDVCSAIVSGRGGVSRGFADECVMVGQGGKSWVRAPWLEGVSDGELVGWLAGGWIHDASVEWWLASVPVATSHDEGYATFAVPISLARRQVEARGAVQRPRLASLQIRYQELGLVRVNPIKYPYLGLSAYRWELGKVPGYR